MWRRLTRTAVVAALLSTVIAGAPASATPPAELGKRSTATGDSTGCRLERVSRRLVHCDVLTGAGVAAPYSIPVQHPRAVARELTTFAAPGCTGGCGSGSTLGPDRALYVTDGPAGRVLRIDPRTGATRTFARGLPPAVSGLGLGGAIDIAFVRGTAYVLVTLVGPSLGQPGVVDGIYRVGRGGRVTPVADLGTWSVAHPPHGDFAVPSGVQYALQPYRGGLLVTDAHHNRVLYVRLDGRVAEWVVLGNTVPTGLDVRGRTIYLTESGPVPHLPETGRVLSFTDRGPAQVVATGARLAVDVEVGRHQLYVLSQGRWDLPDLPENAGLPPAPNTGVLLRRERFGSWSAVITGLDRPTSFELLGDTALVVTLTGKVIEIDKGRP